MQFPFGASSLPPSQGCGKLRKTTSLELNRRPFTQALETAGVTLLSATCGAMRPRVTGIDDHGIDSYGNGPVKAC